ncbi:MAG: tetratricopeptide repeat protein [Pseudomonadota bacterium]
MTADDASQDFESRLVGWKRIGNYLGCSERTARRWEREEALPVHRQQHDKRSTVFALPAELDRWLSSRAEFAMIAEPLTPQTPQTSKTVALVASATLVVALIAVILVWQNLPTNLSPDEARDPIALDLYERGTALWRQRGEANNRQAIKHLTQAVELDETYASAWVALASAWLTLPSYSDAVDTDITTTEALLAADRALQLDPSLVQARSVMASIAKGRGDWLTSERIFREALEVDPDNPTLLLWLAGNYRDLGWIDEAVRLTETANRLEPNSPPILAEIAMNTFHMGDVQEASAMLDYLWLDLGVETPIVWIGRWFIMIENEDFEQAAAWIDATPLRPYAEAFRAYVAYRASAGSDGASLTAAVNRAYEDGLPGWLGVHMLDQAGLTDAAIAILDRDSLNGYFDTSVILFFEREGAMRFDDRFAQYLERLGFFDYWATRGGPGICARQSELDFCMHLATSE